MKKLFLFFIDGIGLGKDSPDNPVRNLFSQVTGGVSVSETDGPVFFDSGVIIPTDACLGVDGIPQSATGQATIFTGVNAAEYLGYHLYAIPNGKLVDLVCEKSLMKVLRERGIKVTSANLYSKEFFEKRGSMRRNKFPVSTLTIRASGVPFRYADDYRGDNAVFADITNRLIRERGYDIELISPERAGKNLLNILSDNQFVFFEYFMTDIHGHRRNRAGLEESVDILSRFIAAIWEEADRENTAVLVVSDHGNSEDPDTAGHTMSRIPTIILAEDSDLLRKSALSIRSLTDIYPWVIEYFGVGQ